MGCQQPCLQYQIQLIIVAPKSSDTSGNSPCIFSPKPYSTQLLKYNMQYDMPSRVQRITGAKRREWGNDPFHSYFHIFHDNSSNPQQPHPFPACTIQDVHDVKHLSFVGHTVPDQAETAPAWPKLKTLEVTGVSLMIPFDIPPAKKKKHGPYTSEKITTATATATTTTTMSVWS